jgi:hypothetical protein
MSLWLVLYRNLRSLILRLVPKHLIWHDVRYRPRMYAGRLRHPSYAMTRSWFWPTESGCCRYPNKCQAFAGDLYTIFCR